MYRLLWSETTLTFDELALKILQKSSQPVWNVFCFHSLFSSSTFSPLLCVIPILFIVCCFVKICILYEYILVSYLQSNTSLSLFSSDPDLMNCSARKENRRQAVSTVLFRSNLQRSISVSFNQGHQQCIHIESVFWKISETGIRMKYPQQRTNLTTEGRWKERKRQ